MSISDEEKRAFDKKLYETLETAICSLKELADNPKRKYSLKKTELPDISVYYTTPTKEDNC